MFLHTYVFIVILVPVCGVAWFDIAKSFIIAFVDGVIILGNKEDETVKKIKAHEVTAFSLFCIWKKLHQPPKLCLYQL